MSVPQTRSAPSPRRAAADMPTPRDTRLRLNEMERWFRRNVERFTPGDQVFLRYAFEYAEKSADADVIADALQSGVNHQHSTSTEGGGDPSTT